MTDPKEKHVLVVGAGIIGAMIAWHLVRDGMRVTIVEAYEPGGVATPCSFGWVNATHGNPKPYFDLRMASMELWRGLKSSLPNLRYDQTGTLYLHFDGHDGEPIDLSAFAASHRAWGYDIEEIGGNALRARAPFMKALPMSGLWAPCEGVAEGADIADMLVRACVADGATVLTGTPVERLLLRDGQVVGVQTQLGPIETDEVVVAAGTATLDVLGSVGASIPMKTPPGILVHTKPLARIIPHITLTKDLHIRQADDGSILAGWDFGGVAGPNDPTAAAQGIMERIRTTFSETEDLELNAVTVGLRPTPGDGFPVVGRINGIDGLTVAVMHSGVTLAPIVGQAVATLFVSGEMNPLLRPFGADRFPNSGVG